MTQLLSYMLAGPASQAAETDRPQIEETHMISFTESATPSSRRRLRYVALVIETSHGCGRTLLQGVSRYTREHGGWSICFEPHGKSHQPPPWLRSWRGDGMLMQVRNERFVELIRRLGVPTVDVRGDVPVRGVPFVGVDCRAAARAAFDHLCERGFRQFGYCGPARGEDGLMDQRGAAFEEIVATAGYHFSRLRLGRARRGGDGWDAAKPPIARWLAREPKPLAVMAGNDAIGLQILDTCHRAGLDVPEQIAVLGSGNDEFVCSLTEPAQTSIDIASDLVGYEAAALLDRMMRGRRPTVDRVLLPPRGVVARASTDVVATADREVAETLRFIRHHACLRIRVPDVLQHVGLSRSLLDARMKRAIGRTIDQEIRRVRLARAKELLSDTEVPIKQIAHSTGFGTPQYLSRAFRQVTGMTPAVYRKLFRT